MANFSVRKAEQQGTNVTGRRASTDFGLWSPTEFFSMSPFALMRRLSADMDRVFSSGFGEGSQMSAWAPPIEVSQHDNTGLKQDEVHVEIADNALTIHGERWRDPDRDEMSRRTPCHTLR